MIIIYSYTPQAKSAVQEHHQAWNTHSVEAADATNQRQCRIFKTGLSLSSSV